MPTQGGHDGKGSKGGFIAFWTSLPGVLTGIAALIGAIAGIAALSPRPSDEPNGSVPPADAEMKEYRRALAPACDEIQRSGTESERRSQRNEGRVKQAQKANAQGDARLVFSLLQEWAAEQVGILTDGLTSLDSVNSYLAEVEPPAKVAQTHADVVSDIERVSTLAGAYRDSVMSAINTNSPEALADALASPDFRQYEVLFARVNSGLGRLGGSACGGTDTP